jgi:hypothetical protein
VGAARKGDTPHDGAMEDDRRSPECYVPIVQKKILQTTRIKVEAQKFRNFVDPKKRFVFLEISQKNGTHLRDIELSPVDIDDLPGMSMMDVHGAALAPQLPSPILLRPPTVPFWQSVCDFLRQADESPGGRTRNAVAVGSPGTGKTATIPVLIRMLLRRRPARTVILEVRAMDASTFYLFRRAENGYEGLACSAKTTRAIAELRNVRDTVLVIEPNQVRYIPIASTISCPFVLVCSPNEAHYKALDKLCQIKFFYYPLWTMAEAMAARRFILVDDQELPEDEVVRRFDIFGGSARALFALPDQLEKYLGEQDAAVQKLTEDQLYLLFGPVSVDIQEGEATGMFSSRIMGCESVAPFGVGNRVATLLSLAVRAKIWSRFLYALWNKMAAQASRAEVGYAFERYCYYLLCTEGEHQVRRLDGPADSPPETIQTVSRPRVVVTEPVSAAARWPHPPDPPGLAAPSALPALAAVPAQSANVCPLYVPAAPNYPLIDAADCASDMQPRVFQCTVAAEHSAPAHLVRDMLTLWGQRSVRPAMYFMAPTEQFALFRLPAADAQALRDYGVAAYVMRVSPPSARTEQLLPGSAEPPPSSKRRRV